MLRTLDVEEVGSLLGLEEGAEVGLVIHVLWLGVLELLIGTVVYFVLKLKENRVLACKEHLFKKVGFYDRIVISNSC